MSKLTNKPARPYAVIWESPRGFANEGSYRYGTREAIAAIESSYADDCNGYTTAISHHITLEAARERAERAAARDNKRNAGDKLQSYISAEEAR